MHRQLENFQIWLKEQSKGTFIFAALILVIALYLGFKTPQGSAYNQQVSEELNLAVALCENSIGYVMSDPKRLKHGKSDLQNLKLNGQKVELEYVRYPQILFLDSGIRNITREKTARDIYCYVKDPRSSGAEYYFNYETRRWVDRVRFRR